jgi:hypothetical protein
MSDVHPPTANEDEPSFEREVPPTPADKFEAMINNPWSALGIQRMCIEDAMRLSPATIN